MNRRERRAGGSLSAAAPAIEAAALHRDARLAAEAGRGEEALALMKRAVARDGRQPELWSDFGQLLEQAGRLEEALAALRRAAALAPSVAAAHSNLGFVLRRLARAAAAVDSFRKAVSLAPDHPPAHHNLGMALEEVGGHEEARACYQRALALDPGFAHAHLALGHALEAAGDVAAALGHFRRAVERAPDLPVAHLSLGNGLAAANQLGEAEQAFRRALELRPRYAEAQHNLANTLHEQGRLDEALAEYDRALAAKPDHIEAEMHRVTLFLYRPDVGLAEQRRAADACAAHIAAGIRTLPQRRGTGDAMPRLGFLSGDFRTHPAGILVLPTLEALARAGHRFACYSTSRRADATTVRFRAAAGEWRDVAGLADAAVADRIRSDRIDLLFDLSGFTAGHRLAALAAKPAPVQIAWAGYPGTTGLAAIDYLLADAHQVPAGAERFYSEAVIRLPHSYVCHAPPAEAPDLAARGPGPILFGSFNALKKITEPVLEAWARILAALPESRLLVKATALDCPATRQGFAERLAARGIGGERLLLQGASSRSAHLAAMGAVDIVLDSFPYSGGVTTLECLWMGLPVVTLPGDSFASRHSLGYLATVGLGELVAGSAGAYVDLALALARDADRLAALRGGMRARLSAAPLCDIERFCRSFEQACREAWARHRAGEPPRSFSVQA